MPERFLCNQGNSQATAATDFPQRAANAMKAASANESAVKETV